MTAKAADLLSLPLNRVAVVLVDFQNDFCSQDAGDGTGSPPNVNNERAARLANDFAGEAAALGAHVIYTQQVLDWDALADPRRLATDLSERPRRWETPNTLSKSAGIGVSAGNEP